MDSSHRNDDFERFASNLNVQAGEANVEENRSSASSTPQTQTVFDQQSMGKMMDTITALVQQNAQMMCMLQQQVSNARISTPEPSTESGDVRNFNVMPDLSKTIGDFTGELGPGVAEAWLTQLERTAHLHSWPSAFAFQTACGHLVGAAKYWLQARRNEITSWELFVPAFRKTFVFSKSKSDVWKRMQERSQTARENISFYFHEKIALCKELELSFHEIKEQVAIGLWSKDLSNFIVSKHHEDEDALYQDIIQYERISHARKGKIVEVREERSKFVSASPKAMAVGNSRRDTVSTIKHTTPGNIRCYNCNESGHISSRCTKPARAKGSCYKCGAVEHRQQNCPLSAARGSGEITRPAPGAARENSTLVVDNGPSPAFTIPVFLEKDNFKCCVSGIIDSGSAISLITLDLIDDLSFETANMPLSFVGINSSKLDIVGVIDFNLTVSDITIMLKFHIVHPDAIPYQCLLGRNFMCSPCVDISFNGYKILVNRKHINSPNCENDILSIEIDNTKNYELPNVNAKLNAFSKFQLQELFTHEYINPVRGPEPETKYEVEIKLLPCHKPFFYRPRRLSYAEKLEVKQIVDELLEKGIIMKSNSSYCSPIVLVKKKDGRTRMCVDFRDLNKVVVRDRFPLPLIDDHIDSLKGMKYYTKLDLIDAFYHISIEKNSQKYTSFVTPQGQFEFTKMPFGYCNSPSAFSRFIYEIFGDLIDSGQILVYIDDILIATKTSEENFDILRRVFQLMVKNLLCLKLEKCSFLQSEIEYLGYLINENGIRPNPVNVKSLQNFPIPRTVKEVHSFLGLASYFRRFVEGFSEIAKPLYDLIKKNAVFKFQETELSAFEIIKTKLIAQPLLAIYSPTLVTELHCDASALGFGAILLQKQLDDKFHPVSYFSRRTTLCESKYHSYELEFLAIIYALKRFTVYLKGIHFTIVTDCNSVKMTLSKKDIVPRIMRWTMFLQDYDYVMEHRSNTRMRHVDALSRMHNILVLEGNTFEHALALKQGLDPEICKIKDLLQKEEHPLYELRNGLLYRKCKERILFYVPKDMEYAVTHMYHNEMGHLGIDKTINLITRTYWFPKMKENVKKHINNCLKCIEYNPKSGKAEGFLHNIPKGSQPFDCLHIDHYGPLKTTKTGHKYIFEIIDGFSKFVKFFACKTTKANEVVRNLELYFSMYSRPRKIVSDRGSCFTSQFFREFLIKCNVNHVLIATGCPRANGQIERMNRTLTPMLAKLVDEQNICWDKTLCDVEFYFNNTINRATGETPSKLLFGRNQLGKIQDKIAEYFELEINSVNQDINDIRKAASDKMLRVQSQNEVGFNKTRKEAHKFSIGEYVMVANTDTTVGVSKKLIPKYRGPYQVTAVLPNDRYVVNDIIGFQNSQLPYEGVLEAARLKAYST